MTPKDYTRARRALGLRQYQLAPLLGVTSATVNARERGKAPIKPEAEMALKWLLSQRGG